MIWRQGKTYKFNQNTVFISYFMATQGWYYTIYLVILLQKLFGWTKTNNQDFRFRNEQKHLQKRLLQKPGWVPIAYQMDGLGISSSGKNT